MSPSFTRPAPAGSSHDSAPSRWQSPGRLGYNGQLHEPAGWWQILGNGYRVYNPALMRFHSPDSLSPFDKGGINAYAYCTCDPINRMDPNGHWSFHAFAANLLQFKLRTPLVTPIFVATAASLAAVGLAVASPNEKQRAFAIAGAVIAATGALMGARYAWMKRKPRAAPGKSSATAVQKSTTAPVVVGEARPPALPMPDASPSRSISVSTTTTRVSFSLPPTRGPSVASMVAPSTPASFRQKRLAPPPPGQGRRTGNVGPVDRPSRVSTNEVARIRGGVRA
ncbi:RHS repeat-associated core domain-containing protein [Stenotrophomonas sp. PD6]|uniref:RHS repeat-associated core domain-containing protein n=1 Tax=Stenotrophomonas sp. PD6 TaxID=3368612 RepID=UPI003BA2FD99